jgi:thiol:disulfide interchange protein DsbD
MNMSLNRFLAVCLGLLIGFSAHGAATEARLVMPVETVKAGETITVGVLLEMKPGWHTYWKNSGDSGMATKIIWTLPDGITAGEIQWPAPEIYESAGLVTYVHHEQAMLLVPLTVGSQVTAGDLTLKARVSWLECEKLCVPGRTEVNAALKISSETKASDDAELIKKWQGKLPKLNETLKATAHWEGEVKEDKRNLIIEFTPEANVADWDFFPYKGEDSSVSPKSEKLGQKKGRFILRKFVTADEGKWPTEIKGLIVGGSKADKPSVAYESVITIGNSSSTANESGAPASSAATDKKPEGNFWIKLLSAFIGGIILNFMPCVLPVISLKILSFVKQSQQDPARVRFLGLIYGAGVLASFLILAGIVIAVHKAGYLASWGMQFQNSKFLVMMIILVTLVALNLFGLFEVSLGGNVMNSASELAGKKGASGAFFNGLLTTVLATSCSAPILGSALSYAIFQPPLVIVLFFLTIGIGLAFPYVLLCWNPAWLKFLPKPGAWMEKFKIALGFPVLAVAIWLLDVAVAHYGRLTLWLGFFLVILSLATWVWGEFVQRGSKRRSLAMSIALVMFLTGYFYALEHKLNWRTPPAKVTGKQSRAAAAGEIPWEPWSTEAVVAAQKSGRPVLVDFTADWCPNCQLNKVTSLEIPSTIAKLKELNFVSLIGDFTTEDPTIAAELRRHGRAAVPLVLVYPGIPGAEPIIMPELFTPGMIQEALDKVAPKQLTSTK